jgi:hypothetical protein
MSNLDFGSIVSAESSEQVMFTVQIRNIGHGFMCGWGSDGCPVYYAGHMGKTVPLNRTPESIVWDGTYESNKSNGTYGKKT